MGILKNVASQKVGFVMVDKTDFATPETGITVSGVIRKDGAASAAVSNTVSELTNGYYVLTLGQAETNANLVQLRFHDSGASCATQFITLYTERDPTTPDNNITSILADTRSITSILADTKSITSILADTKSITSILADTKSITAIQDTVESILADTKSITAIQDTVESILADTKSITTIEDVIASILVDTKNLSNATYGLNALETLISTVDDIVDSILADTRSITSILADTKSITSILADTKSITAIQDTATSILTYTNRVYKFINNPLSIVNATGDATLRDAGDTADIATWDITDDDTTTLRTVISWV